MMKKNCNIYFAKIFIFNDCFFFNDLLLTLRRAIYDKRISQEVYGEDLGEEFAGYVIFFSMTTQF